MPKRKLHKLINTIEHKQCGGICKKWLPLDQFGTDKRTVDGKQSICKPCKKKYDKQRHKVALEKLKKERETAPPGFSVCMNTYCIVKALQPLDHFIGVHVHNDKPRDCCQTCLKKIRERNKKRYAPCQKVWDDWRKIHPCVKCINNPNYKHNYLLIEADHLGGKVTHCSNVSYWSVKSRGAPALRAELMKCQALCKFHHALQTQQRSNKSERPWVLRKRAIINAEKYRRGCCLKCKRVLNKGEECAFHFDHRDPKTKFEYRGKLLDPSNFVKLPQALFDKQWPLEQAKCDLLCANCHKLKTFANRDGYRK